VAKTRKVSVVDSYSAVKVARRAAADAKVADRHDEAKLTDHIARTAVPTKRIVVCYECGYSFQIHGRVPKTNCSKCRATLDLSDHAIESKWTRSLKTVGTVYVTSQGRVADGEVVGYDVVLAGLVDGGKLRALRRLEIRPGAEFEQQRIEARDLLIATGAEIQWHNTARFCDVEIAGRFKANLHASGKLIIRAGGWLDGEAHAAHLVVEDGAGLTGWVDVRS
jgi:cytoskeletal protein CcmA (bactofilin family)